LYYLPAIHSDLIAVPNEESPNPGLTVWPSSTTVQEGKPASFRVEAEKVPQKGEACQSYYY
jgi:hypothetical protein